MVLLWRRKKKVQPALGRGSELRFGDLELCEHTCVIAKFHARIILGIGVEGSPDPSSTTRSTRHRISAWLFETSRPMGKEQGGLCHLPRLAERPGRLSLSRLPPHIIDFSSHLVRGQTISCVADSFLVSHCTVLVYKRSHGNSATTSMDFGGRTSQQHACRVRSLARIAECSNLGVLCSDEVDCVGCASHPAHALRDGAAQSQSYIWLHQSRR